MHLKTNFTLVSITIIFTGLGCEKKHANGLPPEQKQKVIVTTIAGDGTDGHADGPALSAKFHTPADVAVAGDGTIYVADYNDNRIRKISGGQVSTPAGNGSYGIENGPGKSAEFEGPFRIVVDANGNLYVVDYEDPRIRKISPDAYVSTYAGTAAPGFLNGGTLMAQFLLSIQGIAADGQGNVYIDDTFNERIRKINTAAGQVSTYAGSGDVGFKDGDTAIAAFSYPAGLAFDPQGNLYVADAGNYCIRKITPGGLVSKFAGSGTRGFLDGNAEIAQFNRMGDMVADAQGNLFVADEYRIRKVTPEGAVSTIAGSTAGYMDGPGDIAKFAWPAGLGIDSKGNVYVADSYSNRIRKISFQ
jgi:sugar lactone lactonase YvrE